MSKKSSKRPSSGKMSRRERTYRIILWILVLGMILPTIITLITLNMDAVTQSDVDAAKAEAEALKQKIAETEMQLAAIRDDENTLIEQKRLVDEKINLYNDEIEQLDLAIAGLNEEIERCRGEIADLEAQQAQKYETFRQRVRVLYEEGTLSYLDIVLSAENIIDFFDRTEMVSEVFAHDRELMDDLRQLQTDIELKQSELQSELDESVALQSEQTAARDLLMKEQADAEIMLMGLEEGESQNEALVEEYQRLWAEAMEREEKLAKELEEQRRREEEERKRREEEERKRREEEERKRKEEEERKRKEEEARLAEEARKRAEAERKAKEEAERKAKEEAERKAREEAERKARENATFLWPTPGYTWITSPFGYRTHPVTKKPLSFHYGIDIGAYAGSSIQCIAAGTVIFSGYDNVYGNMVKVDHGNGFISLYAHMNARPRVKQGSTVSKGTILGYVGNTGISSGYHLHFGLYKNGSAVNPLDYVQKY